LLATLKHALFVAEIRKDDVMTISQNIQTIVKSEVTAAVADFMIKFNAGDIDAVMELQSEGCIVMPPFGAVARGKDQVRAFWTDVVQNVGMTDISYQIVEVEALTRDIASELTMYEGTIAGVRQAGKYCVIWKREEGSWKLSHDTFNAAPIE
jgi:ketosteroid isomerase-like protein